MTTPRTPLELVGGDARLAAVLLAVGGRSLGGASIRGGSRSARDAWVACVEALNDISQGRLHIPLDIGDDALTGGADPIASFIHGVPVRTMGLLERAGHAAPAVVAMADRWSPAAAARLWQALDAEPPKAQGGTGRRVVIALDEGLDETERPAAQLLDRLAFLVDLAVVREADLQMTDLLRTSCLQARQRLPAVEVVEEIVTALVECGAALGVDSGHADTFALATTRAHAALSGRDRASEADAAVAVRLVYAPRATQLPAAQQPSAADQGAGEPPPPAAEAPDSLGPTQPGPHGPHEEADRLLEGVATALPKGLLSGETADVGRSRRPGGLGSARKTSRPSRSGRRSRSRKGDPRRDGPLDLMATVLAAAPWQRLRASWMRRHDGTARARSLLIAPGDVHVKTFECRAPCTTIFAVDASGSAAHARLDEAKGAVELLLAECYVRRDRVSLISFRRQTAEVLLPPTRSLTRAKRALSGLPGGGGTPLADGLELALGQAELERRAGHATLIVVLTDGHANIDRSGRAGRRSADADALAAAQAIRASRHAALLIDISPRANAKAVAVADAMGGRYVTLPDADAKRIFGVVRSASAGYAR